MPEWWEQLTRPQKVILGVAACVIVLVVLSHVSSGSSAVPSAGAGSSASAVLVDHQANGEWTSPTFDAPSDWSITYSYDCSGHPGAFIVEVYGPGSNLSSDGTNEIQTKGQGTTYVHDVSGQGAYLKVLSACHWQMAASG